MNRRSKIRLILGCCLLLVLFSACRPKGVLSRKEMADVLLDLHLTEAALNGAHSTPPETWTKGLETDYFKDMAYRSVLRKHNLTQQTFDYSVAWYSRHLKQFEKVYMDVQARMDNFRAAIDRGLFDKNDDQTLAGLDSMHVRALFVFGLYRADTIPVRRLYLIADSLPSFSTWASKQWLYSCPKDTSRLNLFPELLTPSKPTSDASDSLKSVADSLRRAQEESALPALQKPVLNPGGGRLPKPNPEPNHWK